MIALLLMIAAAFPGKLATSEPPGWRPAREELLFALKAARAPKLRTRRQFAEDEVVLSKGPFKGRRFRCDRQPFARLLLDEMDSGRWRWFIVTGCIQSGKTVSASLIPVLFHLFEIGETVGFALPDMQMASDKWDEDLKPEIERSKYAPLIPSTGEGSRGGTVKNRVLFRNGSALKFFAAGGGDKGRAAYTTRVMIFTELEAFGAKGEASEESNKFDQLVGRTLASGQDSIVYGECTLTVETGLTWRLFKSGTQSRIACHCPHCSDYVTPEREQLVGWQDASSVVEAGQRGHFICPSCEHPISDDERRVMNERAVLLHHGQSIDQAGTITGEPPATYTLGFRWNAFNNLFWPSGFIAEQEWEAARSGNEDEAERKMAQQYWAVPYKPAGLETVILEANQVQTRLASKTQGRGVVPSGSIALVLTADLGKRWLHYTAKSFLPDGSPHVVDYGRLVVPGDELGAALGILSTLREFRERIALTGYVIEGGDERWIPDQVWIDARFQGGQKGDDAVYAFIRSLPAAERERFRPILGFGPGQLGFERYHKPTGKSKHVLAIGEGYHFVRDLPAGVTVVELDTGYWKGKLHDCLALPLQTPRLAGTLTLFWVPLPLEHHTFAKHLIAERRQRSFIAGKGEVDQWLRVSRANHWLDSGMSAMAAGHFCGVRIIPPAPKPAPVQQPPPRINTPDGRAFFIGER